MHTWAELPDDVARRIAAQERDAIAELATWAYAHRPYQADDDALHDLFAALMEGMKRPTSSVKGLLSAIGFRQRALRIRRACAAVRGRPELFRRKHAFGVPADARLLAAETAASVTAALAALTPIRRDILVRRVVRGEDYKTIAAAIFPNHDEVKAVKRVYFALAAARSVLMKALADFDLEEFAATDVRLRKRRPRKIRAKATVRASRRAARRGDARVDRHERRSDE
jgi:DNA-directed RNA polymerase specialized sigma24 family protein